MTTASLSHYQSNGISRAEKGHMVESPPSRFTAVNGRDSSASAPTINSDSEHVIRVEPADRSQSSQMRDASPIRRSDEGSKPLTLRDDKSRDLYREDRAPRIGSPVSHPPDHPSPHQDNNTTPSSHKRKRSGSADRYTSSSDSRNSHGSRGHHRSPSREYQHSREGAAMENHHRPRSSSASPRRDSYNGSHHDRSLRREGSRDRTEGSWYGHGSEGPRPPYDPQRPGTPGDSDARLAEALRRESMNVDSNPDARMGASPDDDDSRDQSRLSEYGTDRTPASGVQVDHRRRKRVFSNRTKTGCMTCRRRKKKCDEQKPECNNCIRGGFLCEGYSNRIEWQKSSREKAPIPLQAKDGEPQPSGHYPQASMHGGTPHHDPAHSHGRERSPATYRPAHAGAGGVTRPILVDEDHERARLDTLSPGKRSSEGRPSDWSKPTWSNPGPPSYLSEHLPKTDYSRVPPLHELSRAVDPESTSTSHRSMVHSAHANPSQTAQQAQTQAQLALQHGSSSLRSRGPTRSEKEKMLAGELYFPNAPELVYERDRCKAAIWRFNNSMNPTLGISREERSRLFRDVVQPREPPTSSGSHPSAPTGRVGENVVVEAPFICDYGYNITIGADVLIDTNCTIKDTCSVAIGARTVIGPNVKLLTATMPIDPRRRKGSQGPSLGRAIVIEEDCWIGAGAIILPGLTVGKSSTVGAGSVVTRNVPRFTVVAGNPARVHRGIYSNDPSN